MTERTWPANTPTDGPGSRTRLALVTGASSGIGRAFARWLGADGYDLVVVGRRRDRLEELAVALPDVKVRPLVADLGTDAGVEVVAELCASEELYMPFNELPPDKANELLHVKVVAPTMLARAAASGMVARGEGTIINVGMDGPTSPGCCPITRSGVRFGQRR
jgi:short-subunit dehydrogenase